MSRRSNPKIPFFRFTILLITLFPITLFLMAYMVFRLCLSTSSFRPFPFPSPTPSPALTNNTVTLPPDSPISPDYLADLSNSNTIALLQSQVAASISNALTSVTNRIPTYHLLTTYHFAPSHTLPDPSVVSYLAHNDPITTQELHRHISRLSELLASGVIDSATLTLTLTPNNP